MESGTGHGEAFCPAVELNHPAASNSKFENCERCIIALTKSGTCDDPSER
ncbi:hypothetical protein AVEN_135035-1, partial [Araneus ventricosus]